MKHYLHHNIFFIFLDMIAVILAFFVIILFKPGTNSVYLFKYLNPFLVFLGVWIIFSLCFRKFDFKNSSSFIAIIKPILICNIIILLSVSFLMYLFRTVYFSRFIVFGTIGLSTLFELFIGGVFTFFIKPKTHTDVPDLDFPFFSSEFSSVHTKINSAVIHEPVEKNGKPDGVYREIIIRKGGKEFYHFCRAMADLSERKNILLLDTSSAFNVESSHKNAYRTIINFKRINDTPHLDGLFKAINNKLYPEGVFIGCVETLDQRKIRILHKYPWGFNYLYYYLIDFPVKRVFPKFEITRWIFFLLTRSQNRVISRAEALGRLASAGFKIAGEKYSNNLFFFAGIKYSAPLLNGTNPAYGLFIRLARIGKGGKEIRVTKFRTMYPYAEYLQEYIYKHHHLEKGGKFKNDFRISSEGRIMRKIWIDELPMLLNLVKGDLKIVGVRPLSQQYFNLYAEDLKQKRISYKPGLIPPFYVDLPKSLEEIQQSERKYLEAYDKKPLRTDFVYFWKAIFNILFHKARSK